MSIWLLFAYTLLMNKKYLDEQTLIEDSFRLGVKIFGSGFKPTFIVGLWRGGSSVGIYVQECLQTLGIASNHISLRTSYRGQPSYHEITNSPVSDIRVHGTKYLVENLNTEDSLLIVDDVFSTGKNIEAVINRLKSKLRLNMPEDVRIATLYQRPSFKAVDTQPNFVLHKTEDWLVFPYEMSGLSLDEIKQHKPFLTPYLKPEFIEQN